MLSFVDVCTVTTVPLRYECILVVKDSRTDFVNAPIACHDCLGKGGHSCLNHLLYLRKVRPPPPFLPLPSPTPLKTTVEEN